jgi:hypothetical protein
VGRRTARRRACAHPRAEVTPLPRWRVRTVVAVVDRGRARGRGRLDGICPSPILALLRVTARAVLAVVLFFLFLLVLLFLLVGVSVAKKAGSRLGAGPGGRRRLGLDWKVGLAPVFVFLFFILLLPLLVVVVLALLGVIIVGQGRVGISRIVVRRGGEGGLRGALG